MDPERTWAILVSDWLKLKISSENKSPNFCK
jgi:hypothetical protein